MFVIAVAKEHSHKATILLCWCYYSNYDEVDFKFLAAQHVLLHLIL